MKTIEDGDNMRGLTGIVSNQRSRLVSERTDDGNPLDLRLQRKKAVVLQQYHGLVRKLACMRAMWRAVQFLLIDLCVGHHVGRVEHAELDSRGEETNQRCVEYALRQITLLNGIDVRFFNRIAKTRSKCDAFVVHAANDRDRRALRLSGTITMICGNISDCVAIGYNVSLEVPLAAQLVLQQI